MLGSLDDADDALQEAQLLAWRGLDGFQGRAPLRHWLYRVTTTTCLKVIRARARSRSRPVTCSTCSPTPTGCSTSSPLPALTRPPWPSSATA
jgi:RNA polymerase sigma-70 factor (ECF subfamily)